MQYPVSTLDARPITMATACPSHMQAEVLRYVLYLLVVCAATGVSCSWDPAEQIRSDHERQ